MPCPFGHDCPNLAIAESLDTQLSRALEANEFLRETHTESIARYGDITMKLTAEAAALEQSFDESNASVSASKVALQNSLLVQRSLAARVEAADREMYAKDAEIAQLRASLLAVSSRVEEMADALEQLTLRHEVALAKINFFEQREQARLRHATERDSATETTHLEVRPMIDAVAKLEAMRSGGSGFPISLMRQTQHATSGAPATPGRPEQAATRDSGPSSFVATPQGDGAPAASPKGASPSLNHQDVDDEATTVDRRLAEFGLRAEGLATYCAERTDLARMTSQLRDVENRNRSLKSTLASAEIVLQAETQMASARARAQETFWESRALKALDHADQWRIRAEKM